MVHVIRLTNEAATDGLATTAVSHLTLAEGAGRGKGLG